jgi:uncharacterized protein YggE
MESLMHSSVRTTVAYVLPALAATFAASPLAAQVPASPPQPPPQITVSAVGQTRVTPDRAMLQVAVQSQSQTAAAAAAENARKQTQVIEAVKSAGVAAAQIRTSGYNVTPEYAQSGGRAPKVTGYRAANMVQVEVRSIDDIGRVIDAALEAGATNIGSVSLYASNTDSARRDALKEAVAKARADAEAAATAAGGSLGALLELSIDPYGLPRPVGVVATGSFSRDVSAMAVPTPIEAGEYMVTAGVHIRWQFVPR